MIKIIYLKIVSSVNLHCKGRDQKQVQVAVRPL